MRENAKKVPVRFLRTHYPATPSGVGAAKPFTIGQEVELDAGEAKSLETYGIVQVLEAPDEDSLVPSRLPAAATVARIEQLMPAADKGEAEAIAELEKIRDAETADGAKPRATVLAALKSAGVQDLPAKTE